MMRWGAAGVGGGGWAALCLAQHLMLCWQNPPCCKEGLAGPGTDPRHPLWRDVGKQANIAESPGESSLCILCL